MRCSFEPFIFIRFKRALPGETGVLVVCSLPTGLKIKPPPLPCGASAVIGLSGISPANVRKGVKV